MEDITPAPAIPPPLPVTEPNIAGFWQRVLGILIDAIVLGVFGAVLGFFLFDYFVRLGLWGRLVGFVIALIYFAPMNSRLMNGQTLGKRLVRTQVVGRD